MNNGSAEWAVIGSRIRAARRAAGMSIQELARVADVSASHISQVERGIGSFSAAVLYSVASQLDLSLDSLFDVSGHQPAVPGSRMRTTAPADHMSTYVLPAAERPTIKMHGGPRWERLTRHAEVGVELLEVVYEPGDASSEGDTFVRHAGREHGLVIEGELTVQVGFETVVLKERDTISFDSTNPHRFWNATSGLVRAIWVVRDGDGPLVNKGDAAVAESHFSAGRASRL